VRRGPTAAERSFNKDGRASHLYGTDSTALVVSAKLSRGSRSGAGRTQPDPRSLLRGAEVAPAYFLIDEESYQNQQGGDRAGIKTIPRRSGAVP
jgi:hypothetical protein